MCIKFKLQKNILYLSTCTRTLDRRVVGKVNVLDSSVKYLLTLNTITKQESCRVLLFLPISWLRK